jgi:hypothetical protein
MSGLVEYDSSDEEDAPPQVSQPPKPLKVCTTNALVGSFTSQITNGIDGRSMRKSKYRMSLRMAA